MALSALDTEGGQSPLVQLVIKHRRHPAGLKHDPLAGRRLGACASAAAISAGVDGTFTSYTTAPSRCNTHTCVSAIETSSPAKYSIRGLLFQKRSQVYRSPGKSHRPLPVVEKIPF